MTFAFGKALGAGIQTLLCGRTHEEAIWAAFLEWDVDLFDEMEKDRKSFYWVVYALEKFEPYAQSILQDWEVSMFDGKPAIELSAKIDLQNGFFYRLFIDIVMKHRIENKHMIVEVKSTKLREIPEAMYGNSNQALSYSVILDKIVSGETVYDVLYLVYKTIEREYEPLPFQKGTLLKAKWIKSVLMDCFNLQHMMDENFFPMHGESCLQFFRPCKYYGMCTMSDNALLASEEAQQEKVAKELKEKYTFNFTLQEIVDQQLAT